MQIMRGIGIALMASAISLAAYGQLDRRSGPVADAQGHLHVPSNYRSAYQFLGAWAVAADQGQGSKELHVVYASPGTVDSYRTDGHFADESVLVKEVFETASASMTTGVVSRVQTLKGWFVMIRDSKNSHPDNKLWGDGWAWSWFDAANPSKTTSTDYKANCQPCHIPAKASEWIYVNGYPVLKK